MSLSLKCDQCGGSFNGEYFIVVHTLSMDESELRLWIQKRKDVRTSSQYTEHYCKWQCAANKAQTIITEEASRL